MAAGAAGGTVGRALALAVPCAVVVGLALGWAWRERTWLQEPITSAGTIDDELLPRVRVWAGTKELRRLPGAVLFGNSLTDCAQSVTVGPLVERRLLVAGAPHAVLTIWAGAFGPLQYYALLDDALAGAPRVAIIEIDMFRISAFRFAPGLLYLPLSRKLPPARAWRARAALAEEGLTLLDPPIYRLEERFDTLYLVPGVKEHWRLLLEEQGQLLNDTLGLRQPPVDMRAMGLVGLTAARARVRFGQARAPLVQVLRSLADELREAGVTVLFYVSPVNVGLFDVLHVREELELPARIEAMRVAAGAAPAEWLDLHALVPETREFRDWAGHMFPTGCVRVADAITRALVPRVGAR